MVIVVPLLPGLAQAVTPNNVHIDIGLQHLYSISWLYGFCLSIVLYYALNYFWPHRPTLIPKVIPGVVVAGMEFDVENSSVVSVGRRKGEVGFIAESSKFDGA